MNEQRRTAIGIVVMAAALVTGGCREDGVDRSVIYLDPSGSATWSILQVTDPGGDTPDQARQRAADFLFHARQRSPMADGLELAGALDISHNVVRDDAPPFETMTVAKFRSVDGLFREIYTAAGVPCVSRLERVNGRMRWTMTVGRETGDGDERILQLAGALEKLRIEIPHGTFVEAVGFKLVDQRHVEIQRTEPAEGAALDAPLFVLVWEATAATAEPRH